MPAAWARWSQRQGFHACVVAIDQQWHVARYARLALGAAIPVCQADGLRLPFQPRSFDVVMCSHVLHHCDWQDAVALLRAMATVARYGVVVHDLVRSWLPYYGARLMLPWLSGNRLTRHDGPLSVLRAYRVPEMRQMARAAGLTEARIRTVWLHRLVLEYIHP
jgi:ubiquinone/menaquinone biosynthesis C-methylase UbiE